MAAINGRNWIGIDISEEYVGIARQRMEVAERMIWDGYEKDYAPEACTKKSGVLTHKEISSLKKKELVELVLKLQEKK